MSHSTITFAVLGAAVLLFVWNRLPVAIVAISAALALYATGVIDAPEAFAGFGDPTVIFIASLFVVSEALDATGVTTWLSGRLVAAAGESRLRLVAFTLLLTAVLSAILTPNGAIAALLPMTVIIALKLRLAPSKLLMPMAFSAHAGALLLLTGSPINVLVSGEAERFGGEGFGFFEIGLVGLPLTAGVVGLALLLGPRLLPDRQPRTISVDLSEHARTLRTQYALGGDVLARHEVPEALFTRASGVSEVVVAPRSELIGERVCPGMATESGDLLVLAVQRQGANAGPGPVALEAGDTVLLEGSWAALDTHLGGRDVLVVDEPDTVRRQLVPLGAGARRTLVVLAAMVVLLATGAVPPVVAGVLAAMALVTTRVLGVEQTYRAISWDTIVLVAALIPVSGALQSTGAAADVARVLLDVLGDAGPHAVLAGLFVVAAVLGVAVSNTATALILIPIGVAAAEALDVSSRPVLIGIAVACTASFLTPISTPGNLMIADPGGYRFGDYWRLGLPMLGLFFVVAVFLVPVIWPF